MDGTPSDDSGEVRGLVGGKKACGAISVWVCRPSRASRGTDTRNSLAKAGETATHRQGKAPKAGTLKVPALQPLYSHHLFNQ